MRNPNANCEICGKAVYRKPKELGNHVVCKEHRSELYKKYPEIYGDGLSQGQGWNKGKSKKNGDILTYGKPRTEETKNKISKSLKAVLIHKGEVRYCIICKKEFYNYPSGNKLYCSRKCHNIAKIKQEVRNCEYCGKEFTTNKKRVKTLCSRECSLLCRRQTDIEYIIEDWLKQNNVNFQRQVPLCNITIVDFLVMPNVVIYCDGDYWHNQPLTKRKDYLQTRTLKENGYIVIRLLGSDIKKGRRPNLESILR